MLCDHGMTAVYTRGSVDIYDANSSLVLQGHREMSSRLWMIDIDPQPPHISASLAGTTQADIVRFYHSAFGSPAVSTFLAAVRAGFIQIPGLTAAMITRHPPNPTATAKGHLDQSRQNQRSTQRAALTPSPHDDDTTDAIKPRPQVPTNLVRTRVVPMELLRHRNHTDLTGSFPVRSKRGSEYIMLMFSEDTNYIHVEPMSSRHGEEHVRAYSAGIEFFSTHGNFAPRFERFDNEANAQVKNFCAKKGIDVQLVPPGMHRTNKAERAIRTFKNHFIAILASLPLSFPLVAWDELLPQAELTLNLLRPSHLNPTMSAREQLFGPYDYNRAPIAPPGTPVVTHVKPAARGTWASHGEDGFYVGPSPEHYRCFRVWVTRTQAIRTTDTLSWHPVDAPFPGSQSTDHLTLAIQHLTDTIQRFPVEAADPALRLLGADLRHLADLFTQPPVTEGAPPRRHVPSSEGAPFPSTLVATPPPLSPPPLTFIPLLPPAPQPLPPLLLTLPLESALPPDDTPTFDATPIDTHAPSPRTPPPTISISATTPAPPRPRVGLGSRRHTPSAFERLTHSINALLVTPDPIAPITYRSCITGPDSDAWIEAAAVEFDRLLTLTNTMVFVPKLPRGRTAAYYNPQVKIKGGPNGEVIRRVRGTIGGDKVDYPGIVSSSTAALQTVKLLLNAVVSEDASWCTADITDFYLGTPLPRKEYMRIKIPQIPQRIRVAHHLDHLPESASVIAEISKGIYGLPHAGKLAQDRLIAHLATSGYHLTPSTTCLFRHDTRPIAFTLVVDDFGIKYKGDEHRDHLFATLRSLYAITVDSTGSKYLGISISHNHALRTISISMPGYITNTLARFGVVKLHRNTNSPLIYTPPVFGPAAEPIAPPPTLPPLPPERVTRLQQIIGQLLYYARCVDPTLITALNKLASQQAIATTDTEIAIDRLLQYVATWPTSIITYRASDMRLILYADASYLSETSARSRAGGVHYLGGSDLDAPPNGSIDFISSIIPSVVSSVAEAEYASLFLNACAAEEHRNTLADLGYPQPSTPLFTDNSCAVGIANNSVKQKRSKAMDMRYHWIRDRVKNGHFTVSWKAGEGNYADFFTKALPVNEHVAQRKHFVSYAPLVTPHTNARALKSCRQRQAREGVLILP
jgi:hypothetical protein